MQAPKAQSMIRDANSSGRIGNNKRSEQTKTAMKFEPLVLSLAPLPVTYDVLPIQDYYFSEFVYTDVWGGVLVTSMNPEVNARILLKALEKATINEELVTKTIKKFFNKYELLKTTKQVDKVIFFPGSNLLHVVNHDSVEKILHQYPDAMIKPHPIMTEEGIRLLGIKYGYNRLINPQESGLDYLINCKQAWGTYNSEIGMMAALLKKDYADITLNVWAPKLTYAPIHRLLKDHEIESNYLQMSAVISTPGTGLILPEHDNAVENIQLFFENAMGIREIYRPMYPGSKDIQFSPAKA